MAALLIKSKDYFGTQRILSTCIRDSNLNRIAYPSIEALLYTI